MHKYVRDEKEENSKRLFAKSFHLWMDLAENPICWIKGHTPRVKIIEPKYLDPYRRIECRICGRRYEGPNYGTKTVEEGKDLAARQVDVARRDPKMVEEGCEKRQYWRTGKAEFGASAYVGGTQVYEFGYSLSVGGRGSETPFDIAFYLPFASLYLQTSLGGRVAEWITQGKGTRENEILIGANSDRGPVWEPFLQISPWTRKGEWDSKDPWWVQGKRIKLNPLDYLCGIAKYSSEKIGDPVTATVIMPERDEHVVILSLKETIFGRPRGRRQVKSWSVSWDCKDGIPFRHDSWKGDCVYGSGVEVSQNAVDSRRWVSEAIAGVILSVSKDRSRYGWKPSVNA